MCIRDSVLVERLGFTHQFENMILGAANLLLTKLDFMLKGAVLFVGLGAQHLIAQFGDFLLLKLDIALVLLAILLVRAEGGVIGFQLAGVTF